MSGIVVFVTLWWVVFLMALPFGACKVDSPEVGHDQGAPKRPYLALKLLITTLITLFLWFVIDSLIQINLIDFRALAH